MTAQNPNAYLKTKIMTASPVELQLMLYDGAIRFLEQGVRGLESSDHESAFNGISRCQSIVMELLNGLRPELAPELCTKLSALYTFMYTRLVEAHHDRNAKLAAEILELLKYERETWVMLMEKLAGENASGAAAATEVASETTGALPPAASEDADRAQQLVGSKVSLHG